MTKTEIKAMFVVGEAWNVKITYTDRPDKTQEYSRATVWKIRSKDAIFMWEGKKLYMSIPPAPAFTHQAAPGFLCYSIPDLSSVEMRKAQ